MPAIRYGLVVALLLGCVVAGCGDSKVICWISNVRERIQVDGRIGGASKNNAAVSPGGTISRRAS